MRQRDVTRAWTRVVVLMFASRSQGMRLGRQPLPATRTQVPRTEARPQTRLRGPVLTARSNARVDALGRARVALARFEPLVSKNVGGCRRRNASFVGLLVDLA